MVKNGLFMKLFTILYYEHSVLPKRSCLACQGFADETVYNIIQNIRQRKMDNSL